MFKELFELFELAIEESGAETTEIELDASQADKLSDVLASLGVDPDSVIHATEEEEEIQPEGEVFESPKMVPPPKTKAKASTKVPTKKQIDKAIPKPKQTKPKRKPFAVEISPSTIEAAKKFFEIGKIGERWYYEANKTIEDGFANEQDRVLFALLLAATSVQNEIYVNFIEAATLFNAIKKDMRENPQLLSQFASDEKAGVTDPNLLSHPTYGSLNMFSSALQAKITGISAKFGNIKRILPMVVAGTLSKDVVRNAIANSVNLDIKGPFDKKNPLIKRLKIANYALTLIDPTFASSDSNWFNVVVDTWMFRIFYPEHAKNKAVIAKLFSNERAYANVARVVSTLAAQAGVSPHVMQAALWTGIKKTWEGDSADVSNYVSAIDRMVTQYGEFWKDMDMETKKLGEVISRLDTETAASIIANKRAEVGKALGAQTAARAAAKRAAKASGV